MVRLGRRYARLVHLAPTLVGTSHPDLARPRWAAGVCGPGRDASRGLGAGPRRSRHLVLVSPVAVFHHGLAGPHPGSREVLSDQRSRHRLRHSVFLGRPHGDVRDVHIGRRRDHRKRPARPPGPVHERLPARPDPRRTRPQNEQIARQRHRPSGLGGAVRRRCTAVHSGPRCQPRR